MQSKETLNTKTRPFVRALVGLVGFVVLLTIICRVAGWWPFNNKKPVKHVIFISMDTTRPDHIGCYGNPHVKTPNIDALARDALLFTNYITVHPTTLASHTSLFSGKYPRHHGVPSNGYMVNTKNIMLAETLKEHDFTTLGFAAAFPLSKWFNFHQGFDHYDEVFNRKSGAKNKKNAGGFQQRAREVTNSVIDYLGQREVPDHLFLFVHYYDPHNPYEPPGRFKKIYNSLYGETDVERDGAKVTKKSLRKARGYAGEITYMDRHIGRLLKFLDKKGILRDSLLVLTSDHGENMFWDPNPFSHGWDTYHGVIQAVCMIRTPGTVNNKRTIRRLASNIDILPTVLDYLGIDIPGGLDGKSLNLAGMIRGGETGETGVRLAESSKPSGGKNINKQLWKNIENARCIYDGKFKYIYTPHEQKEELYDLSVDPLEKNNLVNSPDPDIRQRVESMKRRLEQWAFSRVPLAPQFQGKYRDETLKRLRSLGYL